MARMKIEVLAAERAQSGLRLRDRLVGRLPRYAPVAARLAPLLNLRNRSPLLRRLTERVTGLSHKRDLPVWSRRPFRDGEAQDADPQVLLFADVFNRFFEPETPEGRRPGAAPRRSAGSPWPTDGTGRALDCGRTLLSVGCVEEARAEAQRVITATADAVARGIPVVGLEPSSILTLRDEFLALCPGPQAEALATAAHTVEEFLVAHDLPLQAAQAPIYVHGHWPPKGP